MAEFRARYAGRCANDDCPDPAIREGELVTYNAQDRVEHAACPEPQPEVGACPRCFMVPALNGECGCG